MLTNKDTINTMKIFNVSNTKNNSLISSLPVTNNTIVTIIETKLPTYETTLLVENLLPFKKKYPNIHFKLFPFFTQGLTLSTFAPDRFPI